MTLDEAREHIGSDVLYRAPHGSTQNGIITSVNDWFVFVRYGITGSGVATPPETLTLREAPAKQEQS